MKKLKNHTKKELKKALLKSYKESNECYNKLELQQECIEKNVCPNCLQQSCVAVGSLAFRCSECGFELTEKQYDKLFEKILL